MKNIKTSLRAALFVTAFIIYAVLAPRPAAADFNPNRILEDSDILSYGTMNLTDIQNFLSARGGILGNYSATNTHGDIKTAAQIIYDATNNNYDCTGVTLSSAPTEAEKKIKCRQIATVNPQLILVLLQKEASLIEDPKPSQGRLDWATGYGCPTSAACNPYYRGFGKQVNSASLQFLAYMQEPQRYGFKVGETYIAKDRFAMLKSVTKARADGDYDAIMASPTVVSVTPENQATAALYNYTPHVYNGNYNTYLLWQRYFPQAGNIPNPPAGTVRRYPDGSIIKAANDPKVWLIENGKRRHFANWSTFITRFLPEQIINVSAASVNQYAEGEQIKFANYSLVQTPDKTIYLLVDQEKRPFASEAVFKSFGFNPAELETASAADLSGYKSGAVINANATYLTGALLQDSKSGEIFFVENGTKAPVDPVLLKTKYQGQTVTKKPEAELRAYTTVAPILFPEGTLTKTENYPTVYLISGGKKRPFLQESTFNELGYDMRNVITASSQFLYHYDMGAPIE